MRNYKRNSAFLPILLFYLVILKNAFSYDYTQLHPINRHKHCSGDYYACDVDKYFHWETDYFADFFRIDREDNRLDITFQGGAYTINARNDSIPPAEHGQDVQLQIELNHTIVKYWCNDIINYNVYRTIYLKDKNNGSNIYTYTYYNTTDGNLTVDIQFFLSCHVCCNGTSGVGMDIDTTYCADVFVIPKGDPQIYISKSSINFAAGAGTTTKYDIIEIENHGSPLLIYDASPNKNWITCNPEHANQGQLVDITVSRSNIPQSELNKINHSGTITFSAEDDSGNYGGADLVTITTAIVKPPAFTVSISNAGHYNESPHLVWTSTLAHKYYIYRDPYYAQGYWELIDSTETTSYTDYEVVMTSQAQAEDKFYYKVEARNGAGSTYSNTTSTWGFTMNEANPHEQQLLNSQLPDNYTIDDCYPNPGNPGTTIRFGLPHTGQVSLKIFNIKGELVRSLIDAEQPAGYHEVFWDGKNDQGTAVVTGMYIFVMKAGGEVFHKKFSLIK